jgi:hypothetical protein
MESGGAPAIWILAETDTQCPTNAKQDDGPGNDQHHWRVMEILYLDAGP